MVGETLGSYRVVRKLGEGGMGVVFEARHVLLDRPAAVKVLVPELSRDTEMVGRFFNEARATTKIRHPGIVEVLDFGYRDDGSAYLAMELLEGETLRRRLSREHRLPVAVALGLGRQLCDALRAAHDQGIVHRDLKPENVFLVPDGRGGERVKILDFGIAKLAEVGAAGAQTRTGSILGTPGYMSPEQCRGAGVVDARADQYSLGCMLYEMVVGMPPFVRDGAGELIAAHLKEVPAAPRMTVPELPVALEAAILKLLTKRPETRYPSMAELDEVLGRVAAGLPAPSRPPSRSSGSGPSGPKPALDDLFAPPSTSPPTAGPAPREPVPAAPAPTPRGFQLFGPRGIRDLYIPALASRHVRFILVGLFALIGVSTMICMRNRRNAAFEQSRERPGTSIIAPPSHEVTLRIESVPRGAEVYRSADGVLLGHTPLVTRAPRDGGSVQLMLNFGGHQQYVSFDGTRDESASVSF